MDFLWICWFSIIYIIRRPLACKGRQACEDFSPILFPSPIGSKNFNIKSTQWTPTCIFWASTNSKAQFLVENGRSFPVRASLKSNSNAPPSLNSIIFCASTHSPHSKLWLCRSWYSTSIEYQLFIATGLLFNQFQVENGRSFRVRSSLESVPELELDYLLSF